MELLILCLRFDQAAADILFAETPLFNFSGGIARHIFKYDFARTLVARQTGAKLLYISCGTGETRFQLNYRHGIFAQARVGKPDHGHILDRFMRTQKILNLHRLKVLAATDNYVFFTVDQIDKSVFIHSRHIARIQPPVFK